MHIQGLLDMSLPHDRRIMAELLKLLSKAPQGTMECSLVYEELSKAFPELTEKELNKPYQNSASHWANRVQFARLHCVERGFIYDERNSPNGRGYWTITEKGRKRIAPN